MKFGLGVQSSMPMDSHGSPWVPMGTHGSHGVPMGPHGSPWASMENPKMSDIMDFNETHYSVRQNIGSTGIISIRNVFPLHSVTSKRPESPYGANKFSFSVFRPTGVGKGPTGVGKWLTGIGKCPTGVGH